MSDGMEDQVDEEAEVEHIEHHHAAESNEEEEAAGEAAAVRVHLDCEQRMPGDPEDSKRSPVQLLEDGGGEHGQLGDVHGVHEEGVDLGEEREADVGHEKLLGEADDSAAESDGAACDARPGRRANARSVPDAVKQRPDAEAAGHAELQVADLPGVAAEGVAEAGGEEAEEEEEDDPSCCHGGEEPAGEREEEEEDRHDRYQPEGVDVLPSCEAGHEAPDHAHGVGVQSGQRPGGGGGGGGARSSQGDGGLAPDDLVVVDELLLEASFAVAEVEAPLPVELVRVAELLDLVLGSRPPLVPHLQRPRVVQPDVLHVLAEERAVPRRPKHRSHGRQVPAWEDVTADEVRAAAVVEVVLVLVRDRLDHRLASRHQQRLDHAEVLPQVLVPHRLYHLDRHQPVKLAQQLPRQLPVVAEEDRDLVAHAPLLYLGLGVSELLLADRDPRHPAPEPLHRAHGESSPAATDLEDVVCGGEVEFVEDQVELVDLRLVQRVLRTVEDAGRVHPSLVEKQPGGRRVIPPAPASPSPPLPSSSSSLHPLSLYCCTQILA
eukprot:753374-Hanusia_phi.AAC.13